MAVSILGNTSRRSFCDFGALCLVFWCVSFAPSSLVYFRWILRINSSVSIWYISFDSTAVAFNSDPCGINDIIMYTTPPVSTLSSLMEPQEASDSWRVVTWCYSVQPSFGKNTVFLSLRETLGWAGQTGLPDRLLQGRRVLDPITVHNVWLPGAVVCTRGGAGGAVACGPIVEKRAQVPIWEPKRALKCPHWSQNVCLSALIGAKTCAKVPSLEPKRVLNCPLGNQNAC